MAQIKTGESRKEHGTPTSTAVFLMQVRMEIVVRWGDRTAFSAGCAERKREKIAR